MTKLQSYVKILKSCDKILFNGTELDKEYARKIYALVFEGLEAEGVDIKKNPQGASVVIDGREFVLHDNIT